MGVGQLSFEVPDRNMDIKSDSIEILGENILLEPRGKTVLVIR